MSVKPSRGFIHGKTIELVEELGLMEGQEVVVIIRVLRPGSGPGQGLQNSAGAMEPHWTPEDDLILAEIEQERSQT